MSFSVSSTAGVFKGEVQPACALVLAAVNYQCAAGRLPEFKCQGWKGLNCITLLYRRLVAKATHSRMEELSMKLLPQRSRPSVLVFSQMTAFCGDPLQQGTSRMHGLADARAATCEW